MNKSDMAAEILAARKSATQTQMPWPDPSPTLADAMAIQTEVFKQLGSPLIGWKVGATTQAAQQAFGLSAPFYGPMPQSAVQENGCTIEKTAVVGACEPEYAFKLAKDFPAKGQAINAETASAAIETVHIAIEVIGRAIGNPDYANGIGVTMDFGGNVVFVLGPEVKDWASQDLVKSPVYSKVDGNTVQTGNGEPIFGDPINSVVWLAKTLEADGKNLKAGEWVSTGTCTPAVPAQKGTTYTATFGDFGDVSIHFS